MGGKKISLNFYSSTEISTDLLQLSFDPYGKKLLLQKYSFIVFILLFKKKEGCCGSKWMRCWGNAHGTGTDSAPREDETHREACLTIQLCHLPWPQAGSGNYTDKQILNSLPCAVMPFIKVMSPDWFLIKTAFIQASICVLLPAKTYFNHFWTQWLISTGFNLTDG